MTEVEIIRWHHQLKGNETEQTPEDSEGQGNLACCSLRGCQESDTIEQLINNMMAAIQQRFNLPLKKKIFLTVHGTLSYT